MKVKISEIGEVIGGGTPSTKKAEYYKKRGISWITPKDLSGYTKMYISHGARDISESGFKNSSTRILPKDTVLISSRAPIGYCAIAANDLTTNQGFKSIIPNKNKVLPKYLYYLMLSNKDNLEQIASGSTFKEVSGNAMKNFVVEIPNLEKQREVVNIIDPISKKIELNNQINDNLLELIKAGFNKIVIDKSKEETISKIFRVYSGFAFNKNDWADDGKPIIKIKDINNMTINLENLSKVNNLDKLKRAEKYYITGGEIVIALTGATLGKFGIVPYNFKGYVNQRVGLIFPKLSEVSVLGILLQKDIMNRIISLGHGSAQPNISPTTINKLIVNIDIKSCKKFDKTFAPIYQEIIYNLYEKQLLQNIKQELMLKLF